MLEWTALANIRPKPQPGLYRPDCPTDICALRQIQLPLPPKIDAAVSLMMVEEKPDVTYNDVGGSKEQIDKLREVTERVAVVVALTFWCVRGGGAADAAPREVHQPWD